MLHYVPKLTVKPLSNIRWESRIKSVQPIRYQTPQIRTTLRKVEEVCTDVPSTISDAQPLVGTLENFEFIVGMAIWHDVFFYKYGEQKVAI